MTPTNEQIIAEANRRRQERGKDGPLLVDFIIEVMREGWTPPEPVDPDILAFREWAAKDWAERYPAEVDDVQRGKRDGCDIARAYLAGARTAREQEQERANHPIAFAVRVMAGVFKDSDHAEREARAALAKYRGEA